MPTEAFLARYLPRLEAEMRAVVRTADPSMVGIFGMLQYHLGWVDADFEPTQSETGKRIRPVLCLLTCEACRGEWEQALPAAAAIELLHNFSLVHDDIEDQDETRRGRPVVWTLWGEAQGINAGDAFFALAQLSLLDLSRQGLPATTVVAACRLFNHTCLALTQGQYLDLGFEARSSVSVAEYLAMIERKTAAMVACACEMGGLVAAGSVSSAGSEPDTRRQHLRAFGHHLGLAFQMRDDILGIWGDPAATGKPIGGDIARHKKTLPTLYGLRRSAELRAILSRDTLSLLDVQRATELLEESNSREYTEQLAEEHHIQALQALAQAELHGPAAEALYELADRLLSRNR